MRMKELMEAISSRNIMVVGDVMLDEYLWGNVHRMSPEAPVPIVSVDHQTHALGGAGNVATNLTTLGSHIWLAGAMGTDSAALKIAELLTQTLVSLHTSTHVMIDRPLPRYASLLMVSNSCEPIEKSGTPFL